MSKLGSIIVVVLSLLAGFGGGFVSQFIFNQNTLNPSGTTAAGTTESTPSSTSATSGSSKKQTLAECLTEVWGADKYAAISANSSLATTEDNLAALKCYN